MVIKMTKEIYKEYTLRFANCKTKKECKAINKQYGFNDERDYTFFEILRLQHVGGGGFMDLYPDEQGVVARSSSFKTEKRKIIDNTYKEYALDFIECSDKLERCKVNERYLLNKHKFYNILDFQSFCGECTDDFFIVYLDDQCNVQRTIERFRQ